MSLNQVTTAIIVLFLLQFIEFVLAYFIWLREVKNADKIANMISMLSTNFANRIKELNPEKRYIISFPSNMTEDEFNEAFDILSNSLDLPSSQTHIVVMHGDISMVEFS